MMILVNATAARSSGAVSILNQFINHIPFDPNINYILFVDPDYAQTKKKNVVYIKVDTRKWIDRIIWDRWGLKKWCLKNHIYPNLIISLQNTGVFYNKDVPQLIYYHQPLPLSNYRWNFFRKGEFEFFLYKQFYSYFVSSYMNDNSYFIVQIPSIKAAFLKKFSIQEDHIFVIPPEMDLCKKEISSSCRFEDGFKHFIYPATPLIYKNHVMLLQALVFIKKIDPSLLSTIRIHLTMRENDYTKFYQNIIEKRLVDNFVFEGVIPHSQLLSMYKKMTALLFPSFIESLGLPLLEAASAGIPIVVADLPYAHDVVGEYKGTQFVKHDIAEEWAYKIIELCNTQLSNSSFSFVSQRYKHTWTTFFDIVKSLKK